MDVRELKALAERCLRLASASTDPDLAQQLRAIADTYLQKAAAAEPAPAAQQQQQIQPDKSDKPED